MDPSEVQNTEYVCNGENGSNGLSTLVSVSTESVGVNCSNGGIKLLSGLDTNGNSSLDSNEVTNTKYICNGTNGTNGTNGLNSLISITAESAGSNCPVGGNKVTSGLDSNGNDILDTNEISATRYICDGIQGSSGTGLTWERVTGVSKQAVSNTGYLIDNPSLVTVTLPAAPSIGDIVQVTGVGSGGWKIAQNTGQSIITSSLFDISNGAAAPEVSHVASSADGQKLVAISRYAGPIYTSNDSGITWTPRDSTRSWYSVASSSDGTKLVAVANGDYIYTSNDSGATWTPRDSARNWGSIVSSSTGTKLAAVVQVTVTNPFPISSDYIYTSSDAGATWAPNISTGGQFNSPVISADGLKLAVMESSFGNPLLHTSTDSGSTWSTHSSNKNITRLTLSSDGTKLMGSSGEGSVFISTDFGVNWSMPNTLPLFNTESIDSSGDGSRIFIGSPDRITVLAAQTTAGTTGYISGGAYDTVSLQYIGNNAFAIINHAGSLAVR